MTDKTIQKRLLRDRGICVIIPAYNNGATVADVARRTLSECADVIVVDDGSTDDTPSRLRSVAGEAARLRPPGEASTLREGHSLTIVAHDRNRGKGRALHTGFAKALEMGFSYAITIDADGQHYPEDIPLFLEANRRHPFALIVGSRHIAGDTSGRCATATPGGDDSKRCGTQATASRFANRCSNFWFFVQTGCQLPDTQTGYRLYPIRRMAGSHGALPLPGLGLASRYEGELALLVFASWHGTELVPIDVRAYYPPAGERVSHFRPVKDFARISLLNSVLCVLAVVYGLPLRLGRRLMTYIRTGGSLLFFLFFSLGVVTPAVWLYVKCGPMTEKKRTSLHRLIRWLSEFVMVRAGIPGTTFTVRSEAPPSTLRTPHVIISNHQSHLDLMCIMLFTPRLVFLTNDWVWRNPFYGLLIRHAEYYPVSEGVDTLMPRLRSLVERGYSITVFPEGTRSPDCRIGRFHQGAFHIASLLGLDILPVCLYGPGKVLPKKSHTLHKGSICAEVGRPVSRQELAAMGDTMRQASAMRQRYREWYDDICNRMERQ